MQPNKQLLPFHPDGALRPHTCVHTDLPFPSYLFRFSLRGSAAICAFIVGGFYSRRPQPPVDPRALRKEERSSGSVLGRGRHFVFVRPRAPISGSSPAATRFTL
ncbi:hypothetical protein NDU88_008205 [Pleurodeles waltl]|uniref:Uncharacterized protein n=1 Tax=Pleurodeles waltl TaxID=8319 RepID=A0AAV7SUM8_PLEWA|nr:hypothetical protein NDU88_008205 [Pleurodeles waltl]